MKLITKLFGCLCALGVLAATEMHSVVLPPQFTDFSQSVTLPQFNPTNGALVSAVLSLELSIETGTRVENKDGVPYPSVVTGSEVYGDVPGFLTGYASGTFTNALSAYDGVTDFGGTSGATNPTQTNTTTASVVLVPASVTGTGVMPFTFDAYGNSIYTGPGDYSFIVSTKAAAKLTITYTFIPECEPAPQACPPKPPVCESKSWPKPPVKDEDCKPGKKRRP